MWSPDRVTYYFGYGSNMNLAALAAKGVQPRESTRARLSGWRLTFDVHHWFALEEGGVGNIRRTESGDQVQGVVHLVDAEDLERLDRLESRGVGYDRVEVQVELEGRAEPLRALTYVGMPDYLDASCRPTQRYLNLLIAGAQAAGLDDDYIEALRTQPVHLRPDRGPYRAPAATAEREIARDELVEQARWTAIGDQVFDMSQVQPKLRCVWPVFGGRDTTCFHMHRHDRARGDETREDWAKARVHPEILAYIESYLHAYAREFIHVGTFVDETASRASSSLPIGTRRPDRAGSAAATLTRESSS